MSYGSIRSLEAYKRAVQYHTNGKYDGMHDIQYGYESKDEGEVPGLGMVPSIGVATLEVQRNYVRYKIMVHISWYMLVIKSSR